MHSNHIFGLLQNYIWKYLTDSPGSTHSCQLSVLTKQFNDEIPFLILYVNFKRKQELNVALIIQPVQVYHLIFFPTK